MLVKWKARNEVFVVLFTPHYCQTRIAGVFSSIEKAKEYIDYKKTFLHDAEDLYRIQSWIIE